ncbi:MAG: SDR family oxidoreductase [Paludibacter sp.]|jgi:short-subunit dehydrogenase|nr:SDR family oxidoreductase [Paludibacter sp.]
MKSKIILLTGGSAGIGKTTTELLAVQGHTVYSASRNPAQIQEIKLGNGKIIPLKLDVNNEQQLELAVERIIAEQQKIHIVICNAGNGIAGAIEDTSIDEARYQFETCFFGVLKTVKAVLPNMRAQGFGKIIVVSSVAGVVPIPFQTLYSSVKAALISFTQALSLEIKPFGVQCCVILPGDTKTGFTAARKYAENALLETSPYLEKMKTSVGRMEHDEQNGMSPAVIARSISRQINKKKMRLIVTPALQYKLICRLFPMLPARLRMWIVGLLY